MNWRVFVRRHPRVVVLPFLSLVFLGLFSSLLRSSNVRQNALSIPRYFYQQTYLQYTNESTGYSIIVVADKDKASKNGNAWESNLLLGTLTREEDGLYSVTWDDSVITLKTKMNEDGRGMELSELVYFNGKLYTFDDRTGIVYAIDKLYEQAVPQVCHVMLCDVVLESLSTNALKKKKGREGVSNVYLRYT